jgi:hypothetical protein
MAWRHCFLKIPLLDLTGWLCKLLFSIECCIVLHLPGKVAAEAAMRLL